MITPLDNPFYYLENFEQVLAWIMERYADLLCAEEHAFIADFVALRKESRALLVRIVMRKGDLFRASKLRYAEIGSTREAAGPLAAMGWIDADPLLSLDQLFALLKKAEIAAAFRLAPCRRQPGRPINWKRCATNSPNSTHPGTSARGLRTWTIAFTRCALRVCANACA